MLFCTNCKQPRVANEAPCPTCGAPSPLQGNSFNFQGANPTATSWDGPSSPNDWGTSASSNSWNGSAFPNTPEATSFQNWGDQGPQNPFSPPDMSPLDPNYQWNQNDQWEQAQQQSPFETPQENTSADPNAGSLLPVPYQEKQSQNLMVMTQTPMGTNGALVPYEPMPNEGPMYVPPMYTKPRPIIPRYRAVSGLISFIVVTILLCSGTTYVAKVTGKLSFLNYIIGDGRPPNQQPASVSNIPDPKVLTESGPASAVIFSATTASSINPKVLIPIQPEHVFKPGQVVYVTYTVHPKGKGKVTVKWYTNNLLFHSYSSGIITDITNGSTQEPFPSPMEGKVELYWNNQLAIRLYFVVR